MRVLITGASGLIGSALSAKLRAEGKEVVALGRSGSPPTWDPAAGRLDPAAFDGVDAVVHLAGEPIADGRWTSKRKQRILDSRVEGTGLLARTLAGLTTRPKVVLSASAIGFYGDRGEAILDERSGVGDLWVSTTTQAWEAAAAPARDAGIRVAHPRIGIVLAGGGGALAKMLTPFKLGIAGRLGSGEQYMSWIAIDDVVGALLQALSDAAIDGPFNVTAPNPVTNAAFTKTLARVLHRPAFLPAPAFALRAALGQMADELLLASARVMPRVLEERNHHFQYPELEDALRHVLDRPKG